MKSKNEFLGAFFAQLSELGFIVEATDDIDIVAEVFLPDGPFCVITSFGEIIYEVTDDSKVREFKEDIQEVQKIMGIKASPPCENMEQLEQVNLTRGAYYKLMESVNTVMLCRYNGIFGYEFVTCMKLQNATTDRKYYREQICYTNEQAQLNFAQRSKMELAQTSLYSDDEMRLILSCLTRTICIDSALDSKMEKEIKTLIEKTERNLPMEQEFSPRYFYEREQ